MLSPQQRRAIHSEVPCEVPALGGPSHTRGQSASTQATPELQARGSLLFRRTSRHQSDKDWERDAAIFYHAEDTEAPLPQPLVDV